MSGLQVFSRMTLRHAVCGYVQQRAAGIIGRVPHAGAPAIEVVDGQALCGAWVRLPMRDRQGDEVKCQACRRESSSHTLECDCWKLWHHKARHPGRGAS